MHKLTNDRRKWGASAFLAGVVLMGAALLGDGVYGPVPAYVPQGPIAFASLASRNQYALIDFQSSGCFSYAHYRLRYEPAPTPRLLVTDLNPPAQHSKSGRVTEIPGPQDLGVVELTPNEVQRLDNLLHVYRKYAQSSNCTTSDLISVTLYRDSYPIRRERLVDSTCETELLADADPRDLAALKRDDPPVLSLWAVIAQAVQAKKRGLSAVHYQEPPREQTGAYQAVLERQKSARDAEGVQKMVRDLPGYSALCREFRVQEVTPGGVNLLPSSLFTTLTAIRPCAVDSAWWFDPMVNGRLRYYWNQFLAVHREVERVVARHTWISEWKKAGQGRTAEAHVFGVTPTDEPDDAPSVTRAWKHAGLKGAPCYRVLLRRGVNTWAELYFGKDDPRALIIDDEPARDDEVTAAGHWLDGMTVYYDQWQEVPDYVVVSPDGTWKRNTRRR